jgi:hypothetical protein
VVNKARHSRINKEFGRDHHALKREFYAFEPEMWVHKLRAKRHNKPEFTYCEPIAIRIYYIAHDGNINYIDRWYSESEPIGLQDLGEIVKKANAKEMMPLRSLDAVTE